MLSVITFILKYRNELAIGIIAIVLIAAGFYIRYIFNDRQDLKQEIVKIRQEMVLMQKQINLNEDIADAIKRIKIKANNYVSVVEGTPTPKTGSSFVVVPSGVFNPTTLLSSNSFRNISTTNARVEDSTLK